MLIKLHVNRQSSHYILRRCALLSFRKIWPWDGKTVLSQLHLQAEQSTEAEVTAEASQLNSSN